MPHKTTMSVKDATTNSIMLIVKAAAERLMLYKAEGLMAYDIKLSRIREKGLINQREQKLLKLIFKAGVLTNQTQQDDELTIEEFINDINGICATYDPKYWVQSAAEVATKHKLDVKRKLLFPNHFQVSDED